MLLRGFLILSRRTSVIGDKVSKERFELAGTDSKGLLALVGREFSFGHSFFSLCLGVNTLTLARLTPHCEFNERCKPAARNGKIVENACYVLGVKLKLPGGKSVTEAVVKFGSLALREIVQEFKIACTALVFFSPLADGLKAAIFVLL